MGVTMCKSDEKVSIKTVNKMFEYQLTIPDYQRPYKWQTKHIKQLVDDIYSYFIKDKTQECRLGVIVLHKDEGKDEYNIVDGQQRLTSLFLLLYVLNDNKNPFGEPNFLNNEFNHSQSVEHIKQNYEYLKSYVVDLGLSDDFKNFILDKCTFATVILTDIDEAFQYFDSQNSRGKSLEAYDLLKAYHLRELRGLASPAIHRLVERWEYQANETISAPRDRVWLKLIINDVLYRHRRWQSHKEAEFFNKQNVDVFKGLNQQEQTKHPKLQARYAHDVQMNGVILDGEWFFDYVEHYKNIYADLFAKDGLLDNGISINIPNKNINLFNHLKENAKVNKGDYFLFTTFTIMVMMYYDKFGDYELKNAVIKIARWVYFLRFYNERIYFSSLENYIFKSGSLYLTLGQAVKPEQILMFDIGRTKKRTNSKKVTYLNDLLSGFYDDTTAQ